MEEEIAVAFAHFEIPVQWGDMDAAQHVNNLRYIRWVESARLEFLKKINSGKTTFDQVAPILAWQDCKYIFPVTYPDTIVVTYDVTKVESQKIFCQAKVYSKKHQRLVAIANNSIVSYDYVALKKAEWPQIWLDSIEKQYGRSVFEAAE